MHSSRKHNSIMTSYTEFHRRSLTERDAFWTEQARLIEWASPPERVLD